jgi:hypothetical protein
MGVPLRDSDKPAEGMVCSGVRRIPASTWHARAKK